MFFFYILICMLTLSHCEIFLNNFSIQDFIFTHKALLLTPSKKQIRNHLHGRLRLGHSSLVPCFLTSCKIRNFKSYIGLLFDDQKDYLLTDHGQSMGKISNPHLTNINITTKMFLSIPARLLLL